MVGSENTCGRERKDISRASGVGAAIGIQRVNEWWLFSNF
ncbi:uncharacterized protein G2W53_007139 [Senna tora]|uniref:Uncharacterized protein n=1 Tax=Senna tora TaxID=362788 RepID=A0A834X5J9_9FABA|nr:uncharacterized protein G2W53_007139 [Senna tora]